MSDEKLSFDSYSIDLISLIDFADDYPQNTIMQEMIPPKRVPVGTNLIKPALMIRRFDDKIKGKKFHV
jgi:hypothetical protein